MSTTFLTLSLAPCKQSLPALRQSTSEDQPGRAAPAILCFCHPWRTNSATSQEKQGLLGPQKWDVLGILASFHRKSNSRGFTIKHGRSVRGGFLFLSACKCPTSGRAEDAVQQNRPPGRHPTRNLGQPRIYTAGMQMRVSG